MKTKGHPQNARLNEFPRSDCGAIAIEFRWVDFVEVDLARFYKKFKILLYKRCDLVFSLHDG